MYQFWQIHTTTSPKRNPCLNFDKSMSQIWQIQQQEQWISASTSKTRQWSYLGRIRIVNRFRWTFCSWWTSWGCCTPRYLHISLFFSKIGYPSVIYHAICLFLAMIILFQRLEDTRDQEGLLERTLSKLIKFLPCLSIFLCKWSNKEITLNSKQLHVRLCKPCI